MALDEKGNYVFYFKDNPADERYIEAGDCELLAEDVKSGLISVEEFSKATLIPKKDVERIVILFIKPAYDEVIH